MKKMQQSITVEFFMALALMKRCREKNFNYVLSPYKSDTQLTYLQQIGVTDFIMTEVLDLLVFGDPVFTKVILKTNFDTKCGDLVTFKNVFGLSANDKFYTFTADMFRYMCILFGCDYLSSIKGTGIKKAFAGVKTSKDIHATIRYFQTHRKLDFTVDYETQVNRSLHCFKSQIVIDPLTLNQVPLYGDLHMDEVLFDKFDELNAFNFKHGNIYPRTGKFAQSFDISEPCIDCYSMFYFKHKNLVGTTLTVDAQDDHNQVNDDSHAEDDLADVETHLRTHAVPFKVSGSTHHNGMQAALRAEKK